MGAYHYSGRTALIGSGSTSTSSPWLINDWVTIGMSWQSSASLGPSRFTIEMSNADGLQTADFGNASQTTAWSLYSGVNNLGRPTDSFSIVNPGFRWMRVTVAPAAHSATSAVTILANGQSI